MRSLAPAYFDSVKLKLLCFSPLGFMYFSYLSQYAITSLVMFAELCILKYLEVLQFRQFNLRPLICLSPLNFVGAFNHFQFHRSALLVVVKLHCFGIN